VSSDRTENLRLGRGRGPHESRRWYARPRERQGLLGTFLDVLTGRS
jgi:hypothetical protein